MTMATNGGEQPQGQGNAPQLNILAQYIKDFSFEKFATLEHRLTRSNRR